MVQIKKLKSVKYKGFLIQIWQKRGSDYQDIEWVAKKGNFKLEGIEENNTKEIALYYIKKQIRKEEK